MSKLKRRYMEKYLYGINKETLSATKQIGPMDHSQQFLDPNSGNRNIEFVGSFTSGDTFRIKNTATTGSNYLLITSITPNETIESGKRTDIYYDGTGWNVASNVDSVNADNTTYNTTTWNNNLDAATKNVVRDKIELMDSAISLNTAKVTNASHSGDVTGSSSLTIANDAVTYAKMQNVVNDERILGRVAGANGVVQELSATNVRTMINVENGADVTPTFPHDENLVAYWSCDDAKGNIIRDSSIGQNHGVLSNGTFSAGVSGTMIDFDQSNGGNVEISSFDGLDFGTGDFTIVCWVKINSFLQHESMWNAILSRGELAPTTGYSYCIAFSSQGVVTFFIGSTSMSQINVPSVNIIDGEFHQIIAQRESGIMSVFVDLNSGATCANTDNVNSANNFNIGADSTSIRYLDGSVGEVRLYNKALSSNERKALYLNPGGPKSSSVVGGLSWETINNNVNATPSTGYLINATDNNVNIVFPQSPVEGDIIAVVDVYNKATTNEIKLSRNGNNIEGLSEDFIIDVSGSGMTFVYVDVTRGWEIVSEIGGSQIENIPDMTAGDIVDPLYHLPLKNSLIPTAGVGAVTFTRSGVATHIDRYGVVKDLADGVPGYDAQGIDLPPASTNLFTYSQDFSNGVWSKVRSSIDSTLYVAPDGTTTANKLLQTVDVGAKYVRRILVGDSTLTYTFSCFFKKDEVEKVRMYIASDSTAANRFQTYFNIATNEVISSNASGVGVLSNAYVTELKDGWVRCVITGTAETTDTNEVRGIIELFDESDLNTTDGLYLWGAQLEVLPFGTPYIPTTSSPVARNGATVTFPYAENFPGSLADKTVVFDVEVIGTSDTTGYAFHSGDLRMLVNASSIGENEPYVHMDNTAYTAPILQSASRYRFGMTYDRDTTTLRCFLDGILTGEDLTAVIAQSANAMIILGDAGAYIKGKNLRIYDKTLTETQMRIA